MEGKSGLLIQTGQEQFDYLLMTISEMLMLFYQQMETV
jgi:hypothetical protein